MTRSDSLPYGDGVLVASKVAQGLVGFSAMSTPMAMYRGSELDMEGNEMVEDPRIPL